MKPPSGEQIRLLSGDQEAVVTEVGATLREYSAGGSPVVEGFSEDELSASGRGQVLAPWPNRLEDGEYRLGEVPARAALDEPDRHNAIHGLVRWLSWRPIERTEASVTLACPLAPQPAYPFSLALSVQYALTADGLVVTAEARCDGDLPAPFGIGFHPYLLAGGGPADSATLGLRARTRLVLSPRGLPLSREEVEGSAYDFRSPRPIGALHLDDCFTDIDAGADGRAEVTLSSPSDGGEVALWADRSYPFVMCYTGDTLGDPRARRRSVAIEPMSCAPNALRSGDGIVVLVPGSTWRGSWGIRPGSGRAGRG